MSSFALFRLGRRLGWRRVQKVGLSLAVLSLLSLVLGVLAPSSTALAAAHGPSAPIHPTFFRARTLIDTSVRSFHFFSSTEAAVLGNNSDLWLEQGPFGTVPPNRVMVTSESDSFQATSDTEFLNLRFGILSLIHTPGFGSETFIDENVQGYQWLSDSEIMVLGTDGKLWLEFGPFGFGHFPPARVQVDGNVSFFQALSDNKILARGTDGRLWLEFGPFGHVPPNRLWVDENVSSFQALSDTQILVKGTDGKLWLEHAPFGLVPPPGRVQVDGNVLNFQFIDSNTVVVEGTDSKLWLEHGPFGRVPPSRQQIDGNVAAFQVLSSTLMAVKGNDDVLWLEQGPF